MAAPDGLSVVYCDRNKPALQPLFWYNARVEKPPKVPPPPAPLDPKREQIMSTGETFTQWADRLAEALVANLNAKTAQNLPEDPERQAKIDKPH